MIYFRSSNFTKRAGFIGNKFTHFYGFANLFIVNFLSIILISLDAVKNKNIVDTRIPNNIRPIDSKVKKENKIIQNNGFGKELNRFRFKRLLK